ncbi:MAG: hypothetical protein ACKVE4_06815 [Dissulfuribacterales bacterium]
MTTKDEDGSLNAEVPNRLDELFGEDDSETSPMPVDSSGGSSISRAPDSREKKWRQQTSAMALTVMMRILRLRL